jgi:hypothetical protein
VVLSALWARRGQAVTIALVSLLACAAVALAPWYALASAQRVAVEHVSGAPAEERLIGVTRAAPLGSPQPPAEQVLALFDERAFRAVAGGYLVGDLVVAEAEREAVIAHRDGICAHLVISGACPEVGTDVLVDEGTAAELGLSVGDELEFVGLGAASGDPLRVAGTYRVADRLDPYWGDGQIVGVPAVSPVSTIPLESEKLFTVAEGLGDDPQRRVTHTWDLAALPEAFTTVDVAALAVTIRADSELRRQGFQVRTDISELLDRIGADQRLVLSGVSVGVVTLLLITWFALITVVRGTVLHTRGDLGLWQLRGVPAGRRWLAAIGHAATPVVAGALVGLAAGLAGARWLGGDVAGADRDRIALLLGAGLVAVAIVGAVVAVVAAQWRAMRTPVSDLLRRVPPRRGGRLASVVDLLLIVLAGVAVVQAVITGRQSSGLALLAPSLTALAVTLAAAVAVRPVALRIGAAGLHAGRIGVALTGARLARSATTHRLFALLCLAVALLGTALIGADTVARANQQRAEIETGSARVLTVRAANHDHLLAAVRRADPTGGEAMAAVRLPATGGRPGVLAVDAERLPAVAEWRAGYGAGAAEVAALLRPPAPAPVLVTGAELTLEADTPAVQADRELWVRAELVDVDSGEPVSAVFGPLTGERASYRAAVPACAESRGCRLAGFSLSAAAQQRAPRAGDQARLYRLDQAGRPLVAPELLGDLARWRPALGERVVGPVIGAADGTLTITAAAMPRLPLVQPSGIAPVTRDDTVHLVSSPTPLPVYLAGRLPDPLLVGDVRAELVGGARVPVEVAGAAPLLPVLGERGVLVDLESALWFAGSDRSSEVSQVWLGPAASRATVEALWNAGLEPVRTESIAAARARLAAQGPAVGYRFQATVGLVGLLLAAGVLAVLASLERPQRAAELAALHTQGLRPRLVRRAGWAGYASVTAAAAAVGVLAAVAGAAVARLLEVVFVDGWAWADVAGVRVHPVGLLAVATAAVLGAVAAGSAVALVRQTRRRWVPGGGEPV